MSGPVCIGLSRVHTEVPGYTRDPGLLGASGRVYILGTRSRMSAARCNASTAPASAAATMVWRRRGRRLRRLWCGDGGVVTTTMMTAATSTRTTAMVTKVLFPRLVLMLRCALILTLTSTTAASAVAADCLMVARPGFSTRLWLQLAGHEDSSHLLLGRGWRGGLAGVRVGSRCGCQAGSESLPRLGPHRADA